MAEREKILLLMKWHKKSINHLSANQITRIKLCCGSALNAACRTVRAVKIFSFKLIFN